MQTCAEKIATLLILLRVIWIATGMLWFLKGISHLTTLCLLATFVSVLGISGLTDLPLNPTLS